jgi:hypothetical protein
MEKRLIKNLSTTQKEEKVNEIYVDECEIINKMLNYMKKHTSIGSPVLSTTDEDKIPDVEEPSVPSSTCPLTTMDTTAEFQPEIFPLNSSEEEIESFTSGDETTSTDVNLN